MRCRGWARVVLLATTSAIQIINNSWGVVMHIRKYLSIFLLIGFAFVVAGCSSGSSSGVDDETDTDLDGITDNNDLDIDGDGINNNLDPDIDGDGIPNEQDPDMDGDGVDDSTDNTPGGNTDPGVGGGTNKPDNDKDGIPDVDDPDDDNDGIPDVDDPTPCGPEALPNACGGVDTGQDEITLSKAMRAYEHCLSFPENASGETYPKCVNVRNNLEEETRKIVGTKQSTIDNSFNKFEKTLAGYGTTDALPGAIEYISLSNSVESPTSGTRQIYVNAYAKHCVGLVGYSLTLKHRGTHRYKIEAGSYNGSFNADLLGFKRLAGYVSIRDDSVISKLCWGSEFDPRFTFDEQRTRYVMYLGSETSNSDTATAVFTKSKAPTFTLSLSGGKVDCTKDIGDGVPIDC
jgi:hypothetical protein